MFHALASVQGSHSASKILSAVSCQFITSVSLDKCLATCRRRLSSGHADLTSELLCDRKTALKEAFSALMLAEPAAVAAAAQRLVARLRQQEAEGKRPLGAKDALALRLNSQYPEVGSVAYDIMVS